MVYLFQFGTNAVFGHLIFAAFNLRRNSSGFALIIFFIKSSKGCCCSLTRKFYSIPNINSHPSEWL